MRNSLWSSSVPLVLAGAVLLQISTTTARAQQETGYLIPPQEIIDILDTPAAPRVVVSPTGDTIALLERPSMPPLSELAQPMLRLAGYRVNPRTNGPYTTVAGRRITVRRISDGTEHSFDAPFETLSLIHI